VRCAVLLVLLAIAPAAWCQAAGQDETDDIAVIGSCGENAAGDSIGLTALEEECPGLTAALERSGYLALLSTAARDELDPYDLSDLLYVDSWYDDEVVRDVDADTLGPILDSLRAQEPERPLTWSERFKRWLRSLLERRQDSPENWLSRWIDEVDVPDVVARGILYVSLSLIVILTIVVIISELRAAGVFRKRHGEQDAAMVAGGTGATADDEPADLDALPVDRKASVLLRMLVTTLVQSGRLRTERSLTHRELCARAAFDDAQQRESFRRVAALAERTVYGVGEVSAAEVEPIVAAAQTLDAQLRGAPT
jgi:hypothetical protein